MRTTSRRASAVGLSGQTAVVLTLASVAGLAMFAWPLLLQPAEGFSHATDAPFIFVAILPIILAVVLAEVTTGGMDAKALAMLGVLAAVGAVLRPLGAGIAGIELVFFVLILGGRVLGPGFGFVLGCVTLFTSALLTAGVGPWLPFQMLAAGWIGLGAGLLPARRLRGRAEITVLAVYGAISAYAYGFLLNLAFWPFTLGAGTELSYVAGGPAMDNLGRFLLYTLSTSAAGWDTGRAITNTLAIVLLGPAVLAALRRASRRAAFDAPVNFDPADAKPIPTPAPSTPE